MFSIESRILDHLKHMKLLHMCHVAFSFIINIIVTIDTFYNDCLAFLVIPRIAYFAEFENRHSMSRACLCVYFVSVCAMNEMNVRDKKKEKMQIKMQMNDDHVVSQSMFRPFAFSFFFLIIHSLSLTRAHIQTPSLFIPFAICPFDLQSISRAICRLFSHLKREKTWNPR